jgi:tetratricopeptide (TPR) repeat protein
LRARPNYPEASNNLLLAHMKLSDATSEVAGQTNDAIRHYEAVLRIDPEEFRALYNLGTILMDVPERQSDAVRHLEAAVNKRPDSVEARVNLGVVLSQLPGRSAEAIGHLAFALDKRPDLVPVRELLAGLRSNEK